MKWMLMPLRRYADFSGRSRRMEYWMWVLFNILVSMIFIIPLTIITFNAFRDAERNGGVRYRTDFGAPTQTFGIDTNGEGVRNDEQARPPADDWSANPGPQSSDEPGAKPSEDSQDGSAADNDGGAAPDKVSSRATGPTAADGGILAFSTSYRSGVSVDIDPYFFFKAFGPISWALFALSSLWSLITLIPNLAVAIRRLHDTDKSGWWLLIGMVPLVGFIILLVFLLSEGTRGPNRFGADPKGPDIDRTFA